MEVGAYVCVRVVFCLRTGVPAIYGLLPFIWASGVVFCFKCNYGLCYFLSTSLTFGKKIYIYIKVYGQHDNPFRIGWINS